MEKNSIDVKEVCGDVIGVGVDGSGNIIGKDISIVINQAQDYGLNLISPNHFQEYKSTHQDLEDWKKGFSFKLEAIKEKKEFRRSIVDKIKTHLENDHRLLIVGESGTSKSTILMEIMCEYFDYGYKILYDFGESEIKNVREFVKFIEGLLKGGNKILVAIDNIHTERNSAIFYVMDQLSNYELSGNLRFILTARLPEFDWFVNDRLNKVEEAYRHSIRKFTQLSGFRYEVDFLTKDEIEQFVRKYRGEEISANKAAELATRIFAETKGHPIMVKFYVFGRGLEEDVKDRYYRYLNDQFTMQPDSTKIQTTLICSLLDISSLPITDALLESMEILSHAYDLEHATLYQYSGALWKTIHPRWDTELLSFLYNEKNKSILLKRKEYLKKAIDTIFNIGDESVTASIIQNIYDIAAGKIVPIDIIESTVKMPEYLSNKTKCDLYVFTMAYAYRKLQKNKETIDVCNKAIEIDHRYVDAWSNKGLALDNLGRHDEAIECCNKAIEINPTDADVWNKNRPTHYESKGYDKVNYNLANIWSNKGDAYSILNKYGEAIECYDKAIEINPTDVIACNNKAVTLGNLGRHDEAIECCNKAIEIDHRYADAWSNKGFYLGNLGRHDEAIECYDKAIEINPNISKPWSNKVWSLNNLGRHDEAIECCNKAIEINPTDVIACNNKAVTLGNLGRHDEAIECCNKAIEIDHRYVDAWSNKGWCLGNLGRHDEAIECCNKAIEINPTYAEAFYNRACYKVKKGDIDSGLADLKKAIEIGKQYYIEAAKKDNDFDNIKDNERFNAILRET
jgi:tetratricopeptide (TPR) repeat protein